MNLRHVLYNYVNMEDGHSLIAEAHQRSYMVSVNIVIPNKPEAETMVAMTNKQLPVYLTFYIEYQGLDKGLIMKLLTRAWFKALMHEISSCKWDKGTKVLATSVEREELEYSTDIESAVWYRYEVGNHMVDNKKKEKCNMQLQKLFTILMGNNQF